MKSPTPLSQQARNAIGAIVLFLTTLLVAPSIPATAQLTGKLTTNPNEASFVYDDIDHFVEAFSLLAEDADSAAVLVDKYFNRATPGLKMFIEKYDLTVDRLLAAIRKYPDRYAAIHHLRGPLEEAKGTHRASYARLAEIVPDAVFPPTYFLVGAYRGIGSGSLEGPLISIEKRTVDTVSDDLTTLLVHEMVHLQQVQAIGYEKYLAIFNDEKSLLALTVREGIAEFIADRVTGRVTQEEARDYVLEREAELWRQFHSEMLHAETGDWMWTVPANEDQPQHIAYFLGARIVEAYYENAEDKAQAMREILAVTNYVTFVEKSGYAGRFEKR